MMKKFSAGSGRWIDGEYRPRRPSPDHEWIDGKWCDNKNESPTITEQNSKKVVDNG